MADKEMATREMIELVLSHIPQQPPFRFVEEISELSNDHVFGHYRFKESEFFYAGHFPGKPTTPGVILVECMAQLSVVTLGIHDALREQGDMERITLFTECNIEFLSVVNPLDRVTVHGRKLYNRRGKIKCEAELTLQDGTVAALGTLAGVGVKR